MYAVLNPSANIRAILEAARLIYVHRSIAWEFTKREITSRYSGQWFGAAWAVGHPLFLIALYAFIFGVVMKVRLDDTHEMPLDYTAYLLTGVIPWIMSQEAMSRSCGAITENANLVKQVIFPVEVLPVTSVFVAMVSAAVAFGLLVIYILVTEQGLFATYLLFPLVFFLHLLFIGGLAFFLASANAFFRDLKDFVQLFSVAGLFLAPIIYLPQWVPPIFKPILYVNPFSYVIWCYRDVLYYGRIEHPWAWAVFVFGSVLTFTLGYRMFRKLKVQFGNVL